MRYSSFLCAFILITLLLTGCQPAPTTAPAPTVIVPTAVPTAAVMATATPDAAAVALVYALKTVPEAAGAWTPSEEAKVFTPTTLFELMNGQSDAFFVYGFERAAVQRFTNAAGVTLNVAVFQVDTPASAYGLFTANRDPNSLDVGNQGSTSAGQRLSFWQERYLVQLTALKPVADAELKAIAEKLASVLPTGGEVPALISGLHKAGLAADPRPLFFHQELSIQDRVFLGGENKLGLGLDTDGVLAQYDVDGKAITLMLIEFPDAARAEQGLAGLKEAEISDLIGARVAGSRLAAAFGESTAGAVDKLLASTLGQ